MFTWLPCLIGFWYRLDTLKLKQEWLTLTVSVLFFFLIWSYVTSKIEVLIGLVKQE